jgi:hypothetical protein
LFQAWLRRRTRTDHFAGASLGRYLWPNGVLNSGRRKDGNRSENGGHYDDRIILR